LCTLQCPHAHRPDTAIFSLDLHHVYTTIALLSPFQTQFLLIPPCMQFVVTIHHLYFILARRIRMPFSLLFVPRELEVCVVGVRPTRWCGREADLGQPTTHTSGVSALERAGRAPLFIMLSTCLKCAWLVCGRRVGGGREAGPPPPPPLPSSSSH
jgi:hypothetical protein